MGTTVGPPPELFERLRARAAGRGVGPNDLAAELLAGALVHPLEAYGWRLLPRPETVERKAPAPFAAGRDDGFRLKAQVTTSHEPTVLMFIGPPEGGSELVLVDVGELDIGPADWRQVAGEAERTVARLRG
ncbi:MAG TPA: hypothetical protein VFG47_02675 [Geminicoccaceae bacterium]|nr:hypothetical protein [Geminicoccaceae bacterium]